VNDTSTLEKAGFSIKDVSHKLVEMFAEQIFHTGFVHADPHPGNSKQKKGFFLLK
jgi:aarF domain-containing kinase